MTLEPKVYIVGAGPGDPELITVKGSRILRTADVVLYTDSLVNDELIATAKPEAQVLQSSGMDLERQVEIMSEAVQAGRKGSSRTYRRSGSVRSHFGADGVAEAARSSIRNRAGRQLGLCFCGRVGCRANCA